MKTDEEGIQSIIDRIIALPATEKEKAKRILNVMKYLKEEGKTETAMEIITNVAELEKVLG